MQKYELVLLLDHAMKTADRDQVISEFESHIKDSLVEKDDMGIQSLMYALGGDKSKDKAYFVSYCLKLDSDGIAKIKELLKYNKTVLRSKFFKMTSTQMFLSFDKLQKDLEKEIESWGKQRFAQKISFFTDSSNAQYLNWKSVAILNKYVTRFADIKPRRYTGNSVSKQKKLRKAILNARELGLLEYVK